MINQIKKGLSSRRAVLLLFALLLGIGLAVYEDYGVSVDEPVERRSGIISYRYLNRVLFNRSCLTYEATEDLENYDKRYYGVAVQLPMAFAEDLYHFVTRQQMEWDDVFHMRHLYTYLLYLFGLFCLYETVKDLLDSRIYGITAVLIVYTFGRFFAESFYNIKDLVFASLLMVVMLCAERCITSGYRPLWCILMAFSSAVLVSARIVGALLPLLLLIVMLIEHIRSRARFPLIPLLLISCAFPVWLALTPASWNNPLQFCLDYIHRFSDFNIWNGSIPFAGKLLQKTEIPADYLLRWMTLTVPLAVQLFALTGAGVFLTSGFRERKITGTLGIAGAAAVLTLAYQAFARPTIYNGWRHAYYLFPLMVLFAVYGLRTCLQRGGLVRLAAIALAGLSLLYNSAEIILNHPREYAAFNPVGQQFAPDYEGDYWYLSYFDQLKWLAANVTEPEIHVDLADKSTAWVLEGSMQMLPDEDESRVFYTPDAGDYRIFSYTKYPGVQDFQIPGYEEINRVSAYGTRLSALYRKVK